MTIGIKDVDGMGRHHYRRARNSARIERGAVSKPTMGAIMRWNIFGTLDLFAAIGLGITSAAGSPLQLIHAGVGSEAMQYLPFCLVPTVLVPFYLITHAIIAAQLSAQRAAPSARARTLPAA